MEILSGQEPIEAVIFLTTQARESNWEKENKWCYLGLAGELENLEKEKRILVQTVDIPGSQDQGSIWEVFRQILDHLDEEDEVYFDITHSFRYQPMLALLVLHFARVIRNIHIRGIYYGNIEAKRPGEVPIAPVNDLSSFVDVQDWITNVYAYLHTGRAEPLYQWLYTAKNRQLKQGASPDQLATMESAVKVAKALKELSLSLETNRGPIIPGKAKQARKKLQQVQDHLPHPFQPIQILLDTMESQIQGLDHQDPIESGISAVTWCIERGLIQQAYTMLDELVLTAICLAEGYRFEEVKDYENVRSKVGQQVNDAIQWLKEKKDSSMEKDDHSLKEYLIDNYRGFIQLYGELKLDRNDLNHAGWRKDLKKPEYFARKIAFHNKQPGKYANLIKELRRYWQENKPEAF
ncbi:CRISPR-associated protein, TM1812 family [Thermoflavimicrobium dichotomicum]|uniref:CRISPR-associated protein, TM1812 family n=1 Tax=Thermoflavimicrobium dichotomicum TaxID=46223 RepID=A0A1I3MH48_9BACL|nr:CRISPR-associated protein, TM1812 family [Thermoflavimicrobium dichotomicum]